MKSHIALTDLPRGQRSTIVSIDGAEDLLDVLADQGFVVGEDVEVMERGFLGGSPLAVKLGRAMVALRRDEAAAIRVQTR